MLYCAGIVSRLQARSPRMTGSRHYRFPQICGRAALTGRTRAAAGRLQHLIGQYDQWPLPLRRLTGIFHMPPPPLVVPEHCRHGYQPIHPRPPCILIAFAPRSGCGQGHLPITRLHLARLPLIGLFSTWRHPIGCRRPRPLLVGCRPMIP